MRIVASESRRLPPGMAMMPALLVLVGTATGVLIGTGHGQIMIAGILLVVLWIPIIIRWERGLYGLLVYVPFAGAVGLALHPARLPLLFKDILFVAPAYIGLAAAVALGRERVRTPRVPLVLMAALGIIVGAKTLGPGVASGLMSLIGLKVWLSYLPLYFVAFLAMRSREDVWRVMRLLTALTSVPCLVGLAEYALVLNFGYREVMTTIYGELAPAVTQGFTIFQLDPGRLVRIPSTFSFVTQYWGFTLAMLVPCYAVWRGDPSKGWRRVAAWMFFLDLTAAMLSGARTAFVFVPLLIGVMVALDRRMPVRAILRLGVVPVVVVAAVGFSFRPLLEHVFGLFGHYARYIAYGGLLQAVERAPFGAGTGTNTGAARYAFSNPTDPTVFLAIENYYAKAIYELGIPGLLVILALFGWIIWSGWRVTRWLQGELRPCAVALTAFAVCMALNAFKGWQLDLDPINVYFWIFAGILSRLPRLCGSNVRRPGTEPDVVRARV